MTVFTTPKSEAPITGEYFVIFGRLQKIVTYQQSVESQNEIDNNFFSPPKLAQMHVWSFLYKYIKFESLTLIME